jgi:hypothetical protein
MPVVVTFFDFFTKESLIKIIIPKTFPAALRAASLFCCRPSQPLDRAGGFSQKNHWESSLPAQGPQNPTFLLESQPNLPALALWILTETSTWDFTRTLKPENPPALPLDPPPPELAPPHLTLGAQETHPHIVSFPVLSNAD